MFYIFHQNRQVLLISVPCMSARLYAGFYRLEALIDDASPQCSYYMIVSAYVTFPSSLAGIYFVAMKLIAYTLRTLNYFQTCLDVMFVCMRASIHNAKLRAIRWYVKLRIIGRSGADGRAGGASL